MDVTLVVTHDCNLGCDYCFAGEKRRAPMSDAVADAALDLALGDGSEGDGATQISFFGGEPLIEWRRIVRTVARARARAERIGRAISFTITTNGTLLDEDKARFLVDAGFFVGLSIDGVRAAHEATRPTRGGRSSFDDATRALDLLVAHGADFETITVVDPRNVAHIGASVRWLVERGATRLTLNPHFGADWSDGALAVWEAGYREAADLYVERCREGRPVHLNFVENKLRAHAKGGYGAGDRCSVGHRSVAVAPSGNLYPCERFVAEDRDTTMAIGHVASGIDLGRRMCLDAQRGPVADECGGCGEQSRCNSFCACANYAETGSISTPGGVQCWHERMAMRLADDVGRRLWAARDRHFLARVYSYEGAA